MNNTQKKLIDYMKNTSREVFGVNVSEKEHEYILNRYYFHKDKEISYQGNAIRYFEKNNPEYKKMLDLGSGFGNFVLYAVDNGFDCHGIETEDKKLEICYKIIDELGLKVE